jgi:hypothetical protein
MARDPQAAPTSGGVGGTDALYDTIRDLVSALGGHTKACYTCKTMLRRHAEAIRAAQDAIARRATSVAESPRVGLGAEAPE